MMYHVRELIRELDYDRFEAEALIPYLLPHTNRVAKKFPAFVYRDKSYSLYGLFMDYLVRKMISGFSTVKAEPEVVTPLIEELYDYEPEYALSLTESLARYRDDSLSWRDTLNDCYQLAALQSGVRVDNPDFSRLLPQYRRIEVRLKALGDHKYHFNAEYNLEYKGLTLTSHPDIVTENAVIDIKTTHDFSKMAKDSYLQILLYLSICRANGLKIRYAGIFLPLQEESLIFDLDSWTEGPFLEKALTEGLDATSMKDILGSLLKMMMTDESNIGLSNIGSVGQTIAKGKSIAKSLTDYANNAGPGSAVQMFLRPSRNLKPAKLVANDLKEAADVIERFRLRYFVHTPYLVNLSDPLNVDNASIRSTLDLVKLDLEACQKLGGQGVVVHVGKHKTQTIQTGLDRMQASIHTILDSASRDCPLLLETPAGEGTELCISVNELADFYSHFKGDNLRICIDTAHVWATGYDPIDYINTWTSIHGVRSIGLIHLNDSGVEKGSRKDRHAPIGNGAIGRNRLDKVINFCRQYNIPAVVE